MRSRWRKSQSAPTMTSEPTDTVVVKYSGGEITDVYTGVDTGYMRNTGEYLFTPRSTAETVLITSDFKVLYKVKEGMYHEYHKEFETQSYAEKFLTKPQAEEVLEKSQTP